MPFLIRWPAKIRPGSVNEKMILNVDFAPTFLQAAGLKVPADMQGRGILPILQGRPTAKWREAIYYRYYHPGHHNVAAHYGVRTRTHKLIFFHGLKQWELYDLVRDPREMRNEYDNPAYAATVSRLKRQLEQLKKELKDTDQFQDGVPVDDVDGERKP